MKKTILYISFLSLFLFLSCEEPENPNILESNILKLKIESDFILDLQSAWIFLHNADGDFLDYRAISNNDNFTLNSGEDKVNLNLTVIKKEVFGSIIRYNIETITGLSLDKTITLGLKEDFIEEGIDAVGEFEVNVMHTSPLGITTISNSKGHLAGLSAFGGLISSSTMTKDRGTGTHIVSTRAESGEIRYIMIEANVNQVLNLNFIEDLKPFDRIITVGNQDVNNLIYSVRVLGKEDNKWKKSFWLNTNILSGIPSNTDYQIGFLDQFPIYETSISAQLPDQYTAGFSSMGKAPVNPELPLGKAININSMSFDNLQFSTDMDFNNFHSEWRKRDDQGNLSVIWKIWSEKNHPRLLNFPTEFVTANPELTNINSLELSSIQLRKDDKDYVNLLHNKYIEIKSGQENEAYTLTKRTGM